MPTCPCFRIEYDAYRVDLEELNLKPRDDSSLPRLEQAQKVFQGQREQYLRIRDDLSVKVKLLEENRVTLPFTSHTHGFDPLPEALEPSQPEPEAISFVAGILKLLQETQPWRNPSP